MIPRTVDNRLLDSDPLISLAWIYLLYISLLCMYIRTFALSAVGQRCVTYHSDYWASPHVNVAFTEVEPADVCRRQVHESGSNTAPASYHIKATAYLNGRLPIRTTPE
jgi:hypothetical protein